MVDICLTLCDNNLGEVSPLKNDMAHRQKEDIMYRATFETTNEVIYMDDLRSMIKHISGVLRCRKNYLRGSRTLYEECAIHRYDSKWDCWLYVGSMYMHYHPGMPAANWVSLRGCSAGCCKWSVEDEI